MKITLALFNKDVNKEIFRNWTNIWHQSCFCEQTFLEWLLMPLSIKSHACRLGLKTDFAKMCNINILSYN